MRRRKVRKWLPKDIHFDLPKADFFAHFSVLCQSRLLAALLAPFGSPLAPLGSQRVPKGSQRAPKGSRKVPKGSQRAPKGSRRAPKGSQRARKGSQGDLKGSLAPFWHPFGKTFSIFVAFRGFSLNCDSKRKVFWISGPPTMFFASDFAEHPHMTVGTSLWLCFIIGQYFKP